MFVGYILGYIFKFCCGLFLRDENFVVAFFQGLKNLSYFIKGCGLKNVNVLVLPYIYIYIFFFQVCFNLF